MFKEELQSALTIYDIMAISYMQIRKDSSFDINQSYTGFETHNFNAVLTRYIEEKVMSPLNAFENLKSSLIILSEKRKFTSLDYFELLKNIDFHEVYEYKSSSYSDELFKTYNGLNIIYNDQITIYPVLLSNYRDKFNSLYKEEYKNDYLRNRKTYDNASLNCKLQNYILFDHNENNYEMIIHELLDFEDFTGEIYEKREMGIALFPVTSENIHNILNIHYSTDKKFVIKNMNTDMEEFILNRCLQYVDSLKNGIEFLVLPEMLMTPKIVNLIQSKVEEKGIKFTFCGSISSNGNNICHVYFEGDEIFEYYKKIPFELKYSSEELLDIIKSCQDEKQLDVLRVIQKEHECEKKEGEEKISFSEVLNLNNQVHVIDINNFGRIFTYICKDIDDDHYMNISKIMQSDFIFLPACNPSNDLINNAVVLAERYHCTTIMCNTCAALCKDGDSLRKCIQKNKKIGFIVTPAKNDTDRSHKRIYYSFNKDCEKCDILCTGYNFQIDMEELNIEKNTVSLNIK